MHTGELTLPRQPSGCPHVAWVAYGRLRLILPRKERNSKREPSNHARFEQQVPVPVAERPLRDGEFRIGLALDGARLDVDAGIRRNRDVEVSGMTGELVVSPAAGIAFVGDSTAA